MKSKRRSSVVSGWLLMLMAGDSASPTDCDVMGLNSRASVEMSRYLVEAKISSITKNFNSGGLVSLPLLFTLPFPFFIFYLFPFPSFLF